KLAVTDGAPSIIAATDYTVTYKDNTNVGTATATVTATTNGNYSGTASKTFIINKENSALTLTPDKASYVYGDSIKITANVQLAKSRAAANTVEFFLGKTKIGTENVTPINAATGTATFTVAGDTKFAIGANKITAVYGGSDNLNAQTGECSVNLTQKALTATIKAANKVYDGNANATATYTLAGIVGKEDVTAAGTAATFADKNVGTSKTVTATGIALTGTDAKNYTVNASATAKADITAKALTADMIAAIGDQTYTGTVIEPTLTVTDGTPSIIAATDYTVTYKDNINVGSTAMATVTATTDGNYSGTASKNFNINKADSDVTLTGGTFT
ncbi:MAG: YDG domain-containing protein, partial [Ruthenibacterium sp.]